MTTPAPVTTPDLLVRATSHDAPCCRRLPVFLTRGEGVWVWDRDGRRYLDMTGADGAASVGHAHPRVVDVVRRQLDTLAQSSALAHNEATLALMDTLTELTFGDRLFFSTSALEANAAALAVTRRHRAVIGGAPERDLVLCFRGGGHEHPLAVPGGGVEELPHDPRVRLVPFGDVDAARDAFAVAEGRIGQVLVAPVEIAAGLLLPPDGFLQRLRALADEHDALLIFDETDLGVARSSEWFYYEVAEVRPDVLTLSKGLAGGIPLAVTVCSDEVARGFTAGSHAAGFGGDVLGARAALEVMRILAEDQVLDRVYDLGEHLIASLEEVAEEHPDKCVGARGAGLLAGLELSADELGPRLEIAALERGLLIRTVGRRVALMTPSLLVEEGQLDAAVEILDAALAIL